MRQLSRSAAWVPQRDGSQSLREVAEMVFDVWYKAADFHFANFQYLDIHESGKVARIMVTECLGTN